MGNSKIDYYGETLIDLTEDTVDSSSVLQGVQFHDAKGDILKGKARLGIPIQRGSDYSDDGGFVRPEGAPDLDALLANDDAEDVLYMTYETPTDNINYCGLYCALSDSGKFNIEIGYVDESGNFIITSSEISNQGYYRSNIDIGKDYVVIRLTPSTGNFTKCFFALVTTAISGAVNATNYYMNRCIERVGRLPYITTLVYASTNYGYGCYYLLRDAVVVGTKSVMTSISGAWMYCYSLKELDVSGWDTSKWKVSSLASTWRYCNNLTNLDVSNWDTSNWTVTSLNYAWGDCINLTSLDLSNWDTSNWGMTNISYAWYSCNSLVNLDVSTWNTSNWKVTSMYYAWQNNYSLTKLDLSGWDTSKWNVTTLAYEWANCYCLLELDVSTWDTSNWAITSLSYTFSYLMSIKTLDLNNWDTSNWKVTNMASTWAYCYSLENLLISNWNVSNFKVTSAASVFGSLYSLKELDLSGWTGILNSSTRAIDGASNFRNIRYLKIWDGYDKALSLTGCVWLTRENLLEIFNSLGTVTSSTTISLSLLRNRLTSEDIAIATGKGFTVS